MKIQLLCIVIISFFITNTSSYGQTDSATGELGLPGDNLDLYAVLDLFQKSKTIEDFEKSLNDEKTKINNLDLNGDKKVDFIKVETKKDGDDFTFILRDPISKSETQDVAVILVSKDKNKKVSLQIVGDKDLYGKDYIVEPSPKGNTGVTANPAYTGADPVTVNVPASTTTVVVVEQAPIVQYVYSPVYVPYYPPYYYGFYPHYYSPFAVIAVGIYRSNHYYYHGGGYGYHNTNIYVNHNHYNNYNNNSRYSTNTISHNNINNNRNSASTRDANRNNSATRDGNRNSATTRDANKASSSNRGSSSRNSASSMDRSSSSMNRSSSSRSSTSNSMSSRPSSSSYNRSSGSNSGGYRSGGGGGGYRGGGGGRRR
jgi:hypothetical protein